MCCSEGTLQAYFDGELGGGERRQVEEHLRSCPRCRALLARLEGEQELVDRTVGSYLAAPRATGVKAARDWDRLESGLRPVKKESWYVMARRHRLALIGMAAVLTLAIGLSFGSVRAAAARLLSVFRVTKFQAITVTPQDLARVEQMLREGIGSVRLGDYGEIEMATEGTDGLVSLDQAKAAVDFGLRLPSRLPEGMDLQGLRATPAVRLSLKLAVDKANRFLTSLGGTKMLPQELDGEEFTLKIPVSIDAQYGGDGTLHVLQARSPELDMPGDASAEAVRDALLAMPFLPETVKRQIAAVEDWQHTFLVPNVRGSTQETTVDGAPGVYITVPAEYQDEGEETPNALVWEKSGIVYAMIGEFNLQEGLAVANSMK